MITVLNARPSKTKDTMETFIEITPELDSLCERHTLMTLSEYIPLMGIYNKLKIHKYGDSVILVEGSDIRHACVYPFMSRYGLVECLNRYISIMKSKMESVHPVSLENGNPVMYLYIPIVNSIKDVDLVNIGFELSLPSVSENRLGGILPQKCSEWVYRYAPSYTNVQDVKILIVPEYPHVQYLKEVLDLIF